MSQPDHPVRWDVSAKTDEALSDFCAALDEAGKPAESADAALLFALTIALVALEPIDGPIRTADDFIAALGDAITGAKLPGVWGLDDDGVNQGDERLLTLVLNDEAKTRIRIKVGLEQAGGAG